ncbi:phosphotransferase [Marinospirillum sp.]|uniref:phosphotransferase n=1 Tax=Marinospirillum sp. TaxID=2183934 RepID=UPI00287032B1|nr:phosphotransferase [Marinospirillum sp.]MDR9468808.1 phosphotransferase [Marinospirillum sp.]
MRLNLPPLATEFSPLQAPVFMAEGSGNAHWLLHTPSGSLVWRQFGQAPGSDHSRETWLLQQLQIHPWVPRLIQSFPSGLLFEQVPGHHPDAPGLNPLQREGLLQLVMELWQQPCNLPALNYEDLLFDYWQKTGYASPVQPLLEQLNKAAARWPALTQLTHHDLHAGNLLLENNHWVLLDWEYAAPGNPWIDAAALDRWLTLSDTEKKQLEILLPELSLSDPWQEMADWLEGLDQLWQVTR